LTQNIPLPPNAMVLTFDDGFRSNYTLAYPLLKKWQIPATIYLATEYVDERKPIWVDRVDHALGQAGKTVKDLIETKRHLKKLPQEGIEAAVSELESQMGGQPLDLNKPDVAPIYTPLLWSEIQEMQNSGLISFGAHTHTHKIMGRCQDETVRHEVRKSKAIIEERTGRPCIHFCYPNGGDGDSSPNSENILKEEGYGTTVLALGDVNTLPCPSFSLDRLGVTNGLSLAQFELTACGFLPMLHHMRKRRAAKAKAR
ncbi:MAG TPA: polysaccharide deacetylase family protein, partial [Prosthecobacter sp.]